MSCSTEGASLDRRSWQTVSLNQMQLGAAQITPIGAFRDVTLGYFDWEKRDYQKIPIND